MIFPAPENVKIPEGHYQFRLNREPELKKFTFTDAKTGESRDGRKVVIYATGLNSEGEYRITDALLPWEQRYADFLKALGIEHSKDISVQGAMFEADVIHEADRKDPLKSWPRLQNIKGREDVPDGGDDIPF